MTWHRLFLAASAALALSASAAMAAPFTIVLGSATGADGSVTFRIVGDSTASTAALTYSESEETDTGPDFYSTQFTDVASALQLGQLTVGTTADGDKTYSRTFVLSNPGFVYTKETTRTLDQLPPLDEDVKGYSLSFQLTETVYTTTQPADFSIAGASLILNAATPLTALPDLSVSPGLLAPVPLPGSLPLFGVALVVVAGAAGVTRRLRRHAADIAA